MQTIRRIAVGSAFKIGGVLTALIFGLFGLCFVPLWLSGALFQAGLIEERLRAGGLIVNCLLGLIIYVVGILLYGLFGGITWALYAWLYNIVAGRIGGLEVDISSGPGQMR